MKSFINLYDVKFNNDYNFIAISAPDATHKEPYYINGNTWLDSMTGFSYALVDQVAGVWIRIEQGNDAKILQLKDNVFMNVVIYIGNMFCESRNKKYMGGHEEYVTDFPHGLPDGFKKSEIFTLLSYECVWSEFTFHAVDSDTFTITPKTDFLYGSISDSFKVGDTIYITTSRRNNGYFTINDITGDVITVDEALIDETCNAFVFLTSVPPQFVAIVARMLWFDVFMIKKTVGLQSESIGTYSWTAMKSGNFLGYPDDIMAGLTAYEQIPSGGESIFVD
jgi:hypothetical protein